MTLRYGPDRCKRFAILPEGTCAADGNEIDVWVGDLPDRRLVGVICTVDLLKRDTEVKLLLGCTAQQMQRILAEHNTRFQGGLLIVRPLPGV